MCKIAEDGPSLILALSRYQTVYQAYAIEFHVLAAKNGKEMCVQKKF